jgi:hypothetical protein
MTVVLLGGASRSFAATGGAGVHGVVMDSAGVPQMGALVELLNASATTLATTVTDDHGHYTLPGLAPGQYQVRATAAFLVPARRSGLRLAAGAQVVVNLTMTTLFEASSWLPAQKRRADEPADDWKWTLRATSSRPVLRLVDQDGAGLSVSSSAHEIRTPVQQARVSVISGDGEFAEGGLHQVLVMNRTVETGDSAIFRMDLGTPPQGFPLRPSISATAGYERRSPFAGSTRMVTSFQSHPELAYGAGAGMQVMRLASTEELNFGDAVMIDAGTLVQAERLASSNFVAEPFVRAVLRPGGELMLEYRYASGQQLQSSDDLDHLKPEVDVLTDAAGRPLSLKGSHHEISVSRKFGARSVSFAVYHDQLNTAAIAGSGLVDRASLLGIPAVTDPTTGVFRLASNGYAGSGLSASVTQPLSGSLALWGEYDLGTALWSPLGSGTTTLGATAFQAKTAQAGSVSVRGKILRTGTAMKAQYRWQPSRTLTQVNSFNASADEGYMGLYLRQRLWRGRILPQGIDAVVEATNLLEQGYQPVLAPDGHTIFLAQLPRAVQGGLAFNF